VADSTKFGRTSLAHLCELGSVDTVVTDGEIAPAWQQAMTDAGVSLLIAGRQEAGMEKKHEHSGHD